MTKLSALFSRHKDKKFILVEPGGNWGDYLIYMGAQQLCDNLDIRWVKKTKAEFLSYQSCVDEVLYINGGGMFNTWCSNSGFACLQHAVTTHKGVVIVGPSTSSDEEAELERLFTTSLEDVICAELFVYAREDVTFEMFNKLNPIVSTATILQDHDTALHLTANDIIKRVGHLKERYELFVYRNDNESPLSANNHRFGHVVIDPAQYCISFEHWLRVHCYARSVISNRTHSVILSSILGKRTTMFDGAYHKNKSIWLYSLKERGVKWISAEKAYEVIPDTNRLLSLLPSQVLGSYKLNKLMFSIKGLPSN